MKTNDFGSSKGGCFGALAEGLKIKIKKRSKSLEIIGFHWPV
jgi:hypothetical protein